MCGFSRVNAYKYISIAENLKLKNVNSSLQIGVTKLSLLASLSEEKQAEVAETVDLESVFVRDLLLQLLIGRCFVDFFSNFLLLFIGKPCQKHQLACSEVSQRWETFRLNIFRNRNIAVSIRTLITT